VDEGRGDISGVDGKEKQIRKNLSRSG